MRVAVTVEQYWHRAPGGTAMSTSRTISALRALPQPPTVIGVAGAHRRQPPQGLDHGDRLCRLPIPRPPLYDLWQWVRVPPVQLVTGAVDVVHATSFAIPPAGGAALAVTVHDLAFLHQPEHFTRRGNRFFRKGLELTRRLATAVCVPSQDTFDDCLRAGLSAQRLHLVPWGVSPRTVTDTEVESAVRRHRLPERFVLWCGTHEPRKNLPGLLDAFARIAGTSDLDLVLVGPPGWGDALGTGRRPPPDRVHDLGYLPEADLHALYTAATVFCYPSLREGFGMPVLEALAHGTPVVTSSATPMADLVGPAGLVVDPRDSSALAEAILAAAGDAHDRLASEAVARSARFSWRQTALATAAVYRQISG